MKTGRVGSFALVVTCVVVIIFTLRIWLIPSKPKQQVTGVEIATNHEKASLLPDFSQFNDVTEKKRAFFDYLRPAVNEQNKNILNERQSLLTALDHLENSHELNDAESFRLQKIAQKYQYTIRKINTKTIKALLKRVDTVPEAMVLIQAANETGWGTSRFVRQGLNFFGQWCFKKGCGLVPQSRSDGMNHEVAVFKSMNASVASYMKNINSNGAYSLLRSIREDMRNQDIEPTAEQLIYGLVNYSERQEAYIEELLEMLIHNKHLLVEPNAQKPAA